MLLRLPPNTRGRCADAVQSYADGIYGKGILGAQLIALPGGPARGFQGGAHLIDAVEGVLNYIAGSIDAINAGGAERSSPYFRIEDGQPQIWMGDALGYWQGAATK